ncbi:MAG: hypothetical protein HRU07_07440 [Nitrosopumilus sp.]|nr:hypothetical protein [Nitrosopumilus sp.]NRA05972.1 hypothetical protein [Nitrosopumilus sp.]
MIDSLEKIVETNKNMNRIIRINGILSQHLIGSTIQLLKYGEKYNVIIPRRDQLEQILQNTKFLLEEKQLAVNTFNKQNDYFNDESDQPQSNTDNNYRRGNSTCFRND